MPRRDVVITGIGIVSSLGSTLNAFAAALYETAGANGARFVAVKTQHAPSLPGARVGTEPMDAVDRGEALLADRSTLLALQASTRALADAAWPADAAALRGCGVFVGSGSGPTESVQASYKALHRNGRVPGLTLLRCLPCGAASAISIRHQLGGPTQTYANACASSALAIGEAMRAIRHGYLDVALAGGTETPFGDGSIKAWEALRVLAPLEDNAAAACRPFDRSRRGIVLGEGAVFFVLEAAEHAAARGARVRAAVAGYAAASDARHITEPSSQGQVRAMQDALEDAGLPPRDIGSVNAHGTGTLVGDQVEAASIATVFGAGPEGPLVTSTKATHGHLLGASGAIELAASVVSLTRHLVPPTRNLRTPDDGCPLNLAGDEPRHLRSRSPARRASLAPAHAAVMSNSFAFGGSNACLVVTGA